MTRFRLGRKAILNHEGQIGPCDRLVLANTAVESDSPLGTHMEAGRKRLIFLANDGEGLLIVCRLFFIQRRYGEVAEWSKALPC